jgi:hypothetical protein
MNKFDEFVEVVKRYSSAYGRLEDMQRSITLYQNKKEKTYDFIPGKGDQKTGVIGEAFIFEYLKRQGFVGLTFGNHSQKAWDIKYDFGLAPNNVVYVQVKTVSDYSKTQRISTIHFADDYCELYLISLGKDLIPNKLFKVDGYDKRLVKQVGKEQVVQGARMPKDENDTKCGFTGIKSLFYDFREKFPEYYIGVNDNEQTIRKEYDRVSLVKHINGKHYLL